MANTKNADLVQTLKTKFANAKSIVFADYHGLNANQINELRANLNKQGAETSIAKNTLVKVAAKAEKLSTKELDEKLVGPTVTVFSFEDPIAAIKELFAFNKKTQLPEIKAGIVDGKFTTAQELKVLSELPSEEQLLTQVAGLLVTPLSGLANAMSGVQRKFVYALSGYADKMGEQDQKEV